MPEREFEITIGPGGNVELQVKGYKGSSCMEAMRMFEKIVGELKELQQTREFYEPEEHVHHRVEQNH